MFRFRTDLVGNCTRDSRKLFLVACGLRFAAAASVNSLTRRRICNNSRKRSWRRRTVFDPHRRRCAACPCPSGTVGRGIRKKTVFLESVGGRVVSDRVQSLAPETCCRQRVISGDIPCFGMAQFTKLCGSFRASPKHICMNEAGMQLSRRERSS